MAGNHQDRRGNGHGKEVPLWIWWVCLPKRALMLRGGVVLAHKGKGALIEVFRGL
jgi:hypothetical protein